MVAFTAFLQLNIKDVVYFNKNKDDKLRRYAKLAGFTPVRLTRSQTQMRKDLQVNKPATFTSGYLYDDYQIEEYDPDKLMNPNAFIPAQQVNFEDTMKNDCLTFNINQLVRHHFFVTREQVQNLWRKTARCSLKILN
jgi:hypothetical protein